MTLEQVVHLTLSIDFISCEFYFGGGCGRGCGFLSLGLKIEPTNAGEPDHLFFLGIPDPTELLRLGSSQTELKLVHVNRRYHLGLATFIKRGEGNLFPVGFLGLPHLLIMTSH